MGRSLLAMDIGGGTQDILLYEEGKTPENCFKMVLPSPTVVTTEKIAQVTAEGRGIHLTGGIMGGGSCVRALRYHLSLGYPVSAEEAAAKTIKDDLKIVEEMGVVLTKSPPPGFKVIFLSDIDLSSLAQALNFWEVSLPEEVAIAVQDHGHSPAGSNRLFRFEHWKKFLDNGGDIRKLAYRTPPAYLTRMRAAQKTVPNSLVMDTCAAAIWGVLADEMVQPYRQEGMLIVNVGNQHTFAVFLKGWQVYALFEHHTGLMTGEKLKDYLERLWQGELLHQEVFDDGGHGACMLENFKLKKAPFIAVTGPRRSLAKGQGHYFAAPYGDMMLTGCFGLVQAWLGG